MCEHIEDIFDVSQSGIMPFWFKDTQSLQIFLPSLATLQRVRHVSLTDLTKGFKAILVRAGTPDEFANWLVSKKLWHPIDLYLLAVDETRTDDKIIKVCKPAVPEVAILKAWLYCKDSVKDPKAEEKKKFDPNECTTLDAAWDAKY